ncbi:MAG TPA: hypothetical protein VHB77_02055 [Planctomycetaceae bacterium]|nr:hypothetical protein [Planctomycetaceae bacterium]
MTTEPAPQSEAAPRTHWLSAWPCVLYFALALASTWPLPLHLASALPVGQEGVGTVPLFNLWTIWWNADRAPHDFHGYWDAPIFYPARDTFAFSEAEPTSLIVAPVIWWGHSLVAAYNFYLLGGLFLNGWCTEWLLRHTGLSKGAAVAGGAMLVALPFVHWQLGVLQLIPLCGILWTVHAAWAFGERATWPRAIALGLAFAWSYLLCNYYGLFLSVLLIPSGGWLLGRRLIEWRAWLKLVAAVALSGLLVLPIVWEQLHVAKTNDFTRSSDLISGLSAEAQDFTVPAWEWFPTPHLSGPDRQRVWKMSPGYLKMMLALVGIVAGLIDWRSRRFTLFCLTFLSVAFVLALGTKLHMIGQFVPYQALIDHYPGFRQIRSPYRFGVFVQIGVVLLAARGVQAFGASALSTGWQFLRSRFRRRDGELPAPAAQVASIPGWRRAVRLCVCNLAAILLAVTATLEIWPEWQPLYDPPNLADNREWIDWLRAQTPEEAVVVGVPFPAPEETEPSHYLSTTEWMYLGAFHHRRMVNGYSGFFPQTFLDLKSAMGIFPDKVALDKLQEMQVRYLLVRRSAFTYATFSADPEASRRLERVFSDDRAQLDIYRMR